MHHLIVPGIDGSDAAHWQSIWQSGLGPAASRLRPSSWTEPDLDDWCRALDHATAHHPPGEVLVIAHSLGCLAAAHWAAVAPRPAVRGLFLVAPPDNTAPAFPAVAATFTALRPARLPLPALVVSSPDDPYCPPQAAAALAAAWHAGQSPPRPPATSIPPAAWPTGPTAAPCSPPSRPAPASSHRAHVSSNVEFVDVPRGPGRLPVLGHGWRLWRDPVGFIADLGAVGTTVRVDVADLTAHVITDAAVLEEVLVKNSGAYQRIRSVFGESVIVVDGDRHRYLRHLLQPAFHRRQIERYAGIVGRNAEALARSWKPGQTVEVHSALFSLVVANLLESMFSRRPAEQEVRYVSRLAAQVGAGAIARGMLPQRLVRLPLPAAGRSWIPPRRAARSFPSAWAARCASAATMPG